MTVRMTLSLWALVLCAGSTFAQTAEVVPFVTPSSVVADQLQPWELPDNGWLPQSNGNFWASGEYLLTWMRGADLPSLVTTSPLGTARTAAGVLGQPTTSVLFGNDDVNNGLRASFRLSGGYWFTNDRTLGLEAGTMVVSSQTTNFSAIGSGDTILARPFFNLLSNKLDSSIIAFPGVANGSIDIRANSGTLYEAHIGFAEKALDYGWFRLTSLMGYRFYNYTDSLQIQQSLSPVGGFVTPGTQQVTNDNFSTRNTFNGLDMGFRTNFYWGPLSLELLGKVALGNLNEEVRINGNQTITIPGAAPTTLPGGFYALQSNSGDYHSNCWYAMAEAGAALSWQIRPNLQMRVGYSLLQLNGIARAANQVDTAVNTNNFPNAPASGGGVRPVFILNRSDLWVQSLSVGVVFTY